ncbi:MAG: hypothetical protein ABEI77_00335 [Halorientalis sp.]
MALWDDERAQAMQIGAVLLFGALIILLSTYQAFVIPNQNRQIEFNHNQKVQQQVQDLRNAIVSTAGGGSGRSVSVPLGVRYPSRIVAVNPGPAVGSLRTVGTSDPTIAAAVRNATTAGETGDFWDGGTHTYSTGGLVYQPDYNEYTQAPRTIYENTVLYNRFRSRNLTITGQRLIDDKRIHLVTLNGSLSVSQATATAVDVQAVSSSTRTVSVTNPSPNRNVTIAVPTQLNASTWRSLLSSELVKHGGHVYNVSTNPIPGSPFNQLLVKLEPNVRYSLQLTRVGVGTGVHSTDAAYLTTVSGNGSAVPEGSTQQLVVEVRDAFDNPVSGVTANATAERGSVTPTSDSTDGDGRIAFTYDAPGDIDGSPKRIDVNVSLIVDPASRPSFDPKTVDNVTFSVTVQNTDGSGTGGGVGGGGAYSAFWENTNDITCPSNDPNNVCTLDASTDPTATLRMGTAPTADGASVAYAVNDTSVGSLTGKTGTTNASGKSTTSLSTSKEGGIKVYTSSGSSGDTLTLDVINVVHQLVYNGDATAVDGADTDSVTGGVQFSLVNKLGQTVTITDVKINGTSGKVKQLEYYSSYYFSYGNEIQMTGDVASGYVNNYYGFSIPTGKIDMDTSGTFQGGNPQVSNGGTLDVSLYEFRKQNNAIDMTGQQVTVTLYYQLSDGSTGSKKIPMTVS